MLHRQKAVLGPWLQTPLACPVAFVYVVVLSFLAGSTWQRRSVFTAYRKQRERERGMTSVLVAPSRAHPQWPYFLSQGPTCWRFFHLPTAPQAGDRAFSSLPWDVRLVIVLYACDHKVNVRVQATVGVITLLNTTILPSSPFRAPLFLLYPRQRITHVTFMSRRIIQVKDPRLWLYVYACIYYICIYIYIAQGIYICVCFDWEIHIGSYSFWASV